MTFGQSLIVCLVLALDPSIFAAKYQYDLTPVIVFSIYTDDDIRPGALKYFYLQKSVTFVLSFSEEYFVTGATIFSKQYFDKSSFKVYLKSLDGINKDYGVYTNGNSSYNSFYNYNLYPNVISFNGMIAKFMVLETYNNFQTTSVAYIDVYVYMFRKPAYFDAPDLNEYEISEAYYAGSSEYTLDQIKTLILNLTSDSVESLIPIDTEFDTSSVAWFSVKLTQVQLVYQFILAANYSNIVQRVLLSFRLNNDRDFIYYKEGNVTKVFESDLSTAWCSYNLKNVFMASEIRVDVESGDLLHFNFRFIESVRYKFKKPILGSFVFSENDWFTIILNDTLLITGLMFDNIDWLLRFCIYYDINDKYIPYRDNMLFTDDIIFVVTPEVSFFPFRTKKIQLSCLKFFENVLNSITISVKGSVHLTADYTWKSSNSNNGDLLVEYINTEGIETLYGDSRYLQKINSLNRLMSSHYGPSCFTQPHLCDTGFTLQLGVSANLSSEDVVANFRPSFAFYFDSSINDEPQSLHFGCDAHNSYGPGNSIVYNVVSSFLFADVMFPSNAEVTNFEFKMNNVQNNGFVARAYVLVSQGDSFRNSFFSLKYLEYSSVTFKLQTADYITVMFNDSKSVNGVISKSISLKILLETVRKKYHGLVRDVGIVILPDNVCTKEILIKVDRSDITLVLAYRNKVVGGVRSLFPSNVKNVAGFDELHSNYYGSYYIFVPGYKSISFGQVYYILGMRVWTNSTSEMTVTLNIQYLDYFNTFYTYIDKYYLNGGESQYVTFKGALETNNFYVTSSSRNLELINFEFYGSEYADTTAPIFSAGLGGYPTRTFGYGFNIHLNNDNKIVATVVTKDHVYEANIENPTEAPYTLTLVWSKQQDSLNFFLNEDLMDNGTVSNSSIISTNHSFNEYLLVYADYYNNQSDLRGSLSFIKMWSTPISADEVSQLLKQSLFDWSSLDATPPSGFSFGSDCYCQNMVCPCETLETTSTVEYLSRSLDMENVTEDDFIDDDVFIISPENVNNYSTIYFDNIALEFRNIRLMSLYLEGSLVLPKTDRCFNLIMQLPNHPEVSSHIQWCESASSSQILITSPDLTSLLSHLLKTVSYTIPMTIVVKINNTLLKPGSILKVSYEWPSPGSYIYASAIKQSSQDFLTSLSFPVTGACLSYSFKFGGNGFVNLVVLGYSNNVKQELAFFYRQEGLDKWVYDYINLGKDGNNFLSVEFVALKNGLGSGYIAFGSFQFFSSCDELVTVKPSVLDSGNISEYSNHSSLFPKPAIFARGSNELFTSFPSARVSQDSMGSILQFLFGYKEKISKKNLFFSEADLNKDFTFIFWYKVSSSQVMSFTYGKVVYISSQSSSISLTFDGSTKYTNIDSSLDWHFVVVKYERKLLKLSLEVDFNSGIVHDDVHLPQNSSMNIVLENNIFCFQMFKEILFPSALQAAQLCLNKSVDAACIKQKNECEWCNSYYGEWELYPWEYIFDKNGDCLQDLNDYNKTLYQPFNKVEDGRFLAGISDGYEVELSSETVSVLGFINYGLSTEAKGIVVGDQDILNYLSGSSHTFSVWVRHTCESLDEYQPIITTSLVTLICGVMSTNVSTALTPTLVFHDDCLYQLPGKSGLWYNFAFVFNGSITVYIDSEPVASTECISTTLPLTTENNVRVSRVGSNATLFDEIFVGDVPPYVIFWRQLTGGLSSEKVKQMTKPSQFGFCSIEVWIYDNCLPGNYLYENVVSKLESQVTELLHSSITEFLLVEITSIYKGQSTKVCGRLNIYLTVQSNDLFKKVAGINNGYLNIFSVYPQSADDLLVYYSRFTSYKVLSQSQTSIAFSLELFEDERYPISKIFIQCSRADNNLITNQIWSNNTNFILIDRLDAFTEYKVCFALETIRRKQSTCIPQVKTFMTAEGEPVDYPKLSCIANQQLKIMQCDVDQISMSSWKGIPYSYQFLYRIKTSEDSCNSSESKFSYNQSTVSIAYNPSTNGKLKFSFDTSNFPFMQLCVVAYATTQKGSGIGVANYAIFRTQSDAPDYAPDGLKAVFNNNLITFEWNPLESSIEVWNSPVAPGFYNLRYGPVKNASTIAQSLLAIASTRNNQFVLNNASLCYLYMAVVNAYSIAAGPESSKICILSPITKPDCVNPVIKDFYITGPRAAVFIPEGFGPTFFRGVNKSWLFHVNVTQGYDPGPMSMEYLYRPFSLTFSLENYAERSMPCVQEELLRFFNQTTVFELALFGLHPYTSYQVSIQPCNENGCGQSSNKVSFKTFSDIPSCAPGSVHLQNDSSMSMVVSWDALHISCANGDLKNYILKCDGSQSGFNFFENVFTTLFATLVNLHKYELICCKVGATNVNGTGPFSSESCAHTAEDVPVAIPITSRIEMTFSSGRVTILPPNMFDMNGIAVGIHAVLTNYSQANSSSEITNLPLGSLPVAEVYKFMIKDDDLYHGNVNILFDNLLPSFVYHVDLRYFNSIGFGPWSGTYQLVTAESFPDAPDFISNSSENVRTIRVNWTGVPIEKSHGIISSYRICRKQLLTSTASGEEVCFNYTNLSVLQFDLTDLDRGSTHNISVAACNKAGCGSRIFIVASSMGYIDGKWLEWSSWGACSQTCDEGKKWRTRICTPHTEGGYDCFGSNSSFETCKLARCSRFVIGAEGETNCTAVCSQSGYFCSSFYLKPYNDTSIFLDATTPIKCPNISADRVYSSELDPSFDNTTRVCRGYINIPEDIPCESKSNFSRPKMHRLCNCISPDDFGFSKWAKWSFCSETCGNTSIQIRKRNCIGRCVGNSKDIKACDVPVCPVDGEWGSWGNYSTCNSTCGYGYEIRTRECNNPPAVGGGTPCQGVHKDEKPECNAFPCPVDGGFSNWTDWSICSRPCGEGISISRRYCNNPVPALKGKECSGIDIMTKPCYIQNCTSVKVDLIQRTLETWTWKMYDINSEESRIFVNRFNESVHVYFQEKNLKGFRGVEVTRLQAGSIVVYYTLIFDYLYGQMVEFIDGINEVGKITNISIAKTQYTSNDVSCPPPYNISAIPYDKNTVMLTWVRDACINKTDIWLYVYYKDTDLENSTWEWRGLESKSRFGLVPDLITSHRYKAYMLTALNIGNGVPSTVFNFETSANPPERPPPEANTFSPNPTEIYIEWTDIPEKFCNGKILGYRIKYKIYWTNDAYQETEAQFGFNAFTIKNLKPYSLYIVEVYGYNVNGNSPVQYSMCKTIEGVPSIPVPQFTVKDMQSISWWSVSWGPIPSKFVNGILLGYRLVYYLSYQSGVEISGEKTKITIDLDKYTLYYKQRDVLNYAIYNISVAGYTAAGSGPAPEYQARTCKCSQLLYANLYIKNPFTSLDAGLNPSGFFVKLLQEMVVQSCGSCQDYSNSQLYFTQSKSGDDPVKSSEFELKNSINDDVDLSFPIYGVEGGEVAPDSTFSLLVKSPGMLMVVRDENKINDVINKMILGVFNVWPLLLISYAIASLFGILIWFTDQFSNPTQFSKGNSLRGPLSGFWFAFVTMTTIGYGDLSPRSIPARIFAMIWFLTGLILNGLIVGFIVTNLTSLSSAEEFMLYNTKVAALKNSFEYRLAILKNADISQESQYTDIPTMLDDLQNKVVDIVYIDAFSLLDYQSILDAKSLKIASVENRNTGYGFVMSGFSAALTRDIESFIGSKSDEISAFTASFSSRIPGIVLQDADQVIKDIFSKDSPAFERSLVCLGILIAIFIVGGLSFDFFIHRKMCKVAREATFEEELFGLRDWIGEFCDQLAELSDNMSCEHEEERVKLSSLQNAYKKKAKRKGVYEAERMIAMNDKFRYIHD